MALRTSLGGGVAGDAGAVVALAGLPVLLATASLRFAPGIPWAVGLSGAGYAIGRAHHGTVDGWAPVVGALLLLAAELAWWAAEEDPRIHTEPAVVLRRAGLLAVLAGAAALTGFVLVGAAAVSTSAGVALSALGMAAAIGAVAVVLRLLHGAPPQRSRSDNG
ncbi:MAG TPA: hypothetical protein VHC67_17375 [Gaiellaceae bacterium]|nr:hypothetical protein [Gaiellaceae bacterium]